MELSDKLLRAFSEVINTPKNETKKKQNTPVYGTVVTNGIDVSVKIDGSTIATPATALVGVENGDRVDVIIQNHRAVITGNHTSPAITRFGDVYVTMSETGLIVGKLDEDEQPTGASILINPTTGEFQIVDTDGAILAKFGLNSQIGRSDRPHSVTTGTNFQIVDANGNIVATFGSTSDLKTLNADRVAVSRSDANGMVRVATTDGSGNEVASGAVLAALSSQRFGLYDNKHGGWIVYSEPDGIFRSRIKPIQLYSTAISPSRVDSDTYVNAHVTGLSSWSVVMAYCRVGSNYQYLTYIRGGPTEQYMSYYNNGRVIRGGFKVDWANNRFQLRCLLGNDSDYQYVTLYYVYGVVYN